MPQPEKSQILNDSRDQVQSLFGSLVAGTYDGPKLTADQVEKLSEKIDELVGGPRSSDMAQIHNEKGELVNEEGLPIIEVTEPLNDTDISTVSNPTPIAEELEFVPLTALPVEEREKRLIEQERLLDMLEQEEMEEKKSIEASLKAEPLGQETDVENLKAAREMQKKMGKALLRNMAEAREKEEKAKKERLFRDSAVDDQRKTLKPKKSVSFADLPDGGRGEPKDRTKIREIEAMLDWGDVSPGRLRSPRRSTLMTKAEMDKQPMKLEVVERLLGIPSATEQRQPTHVPADSDDESNPSSPTNSDEETIPGVGVSVSRHSDEDEEEEEEFDLDTARHHREIALDYYNKRNIIRKDAATAMVSHSHRPDTDDWDQPDVPLDATLSSPKPKSNVSRFKADRVADRITSPLMSLGPSVLPASHYPTLERTIRTGRLENDQLVGGDDGESASEAEDETVKEVLELLKKGEVHNMGPNVDPSTSSADYPPVPAFSATNSSVNGISRNSSQMQTHEGAHESTVSTTKPKVSKFKLNRNKNENNPRSESPATSISTAERSSLKLPSTSASPAQLVSTPFSMIVESPSFPSPCSSQLGVSGRRLDRPPTILSAAGASGSNKLQN